ncbi:glycosyltransferase family 2 protein [Humibacter sp. BT305]|nr:glycosyltransferase family 2 protein [Humibacter sp. BT305]
MSRVAIITVSYDSHAVLAPFLDSARAASTDARTAVYVADNHPTASSRSEVESMVVRAGAVYVPMADNVGYGSAVNAVARTLPMDVDAILISNPDVLLGPGSVDVLAAALGSDPDVGAVGPRILEPDGSTYPSARAVPSVVSGVGHALFARVWPENPWSRSYRNADSYGDEPRDSGWLSGACLLVRRQAFDDIGGFDERYFMYFEDVDLGYRLGQAGWRNVYDPRAAVTHSGAHSTTGESARMLAEHHRSARRFLGSRYPGVLRWPLRAVLSLGLIVRSALERRRADR